MSEAIFFVVDPASDREFVLIEWGSLEGPGLERRWHPVTYREGERPAHGAPGSIGYSPGVMYYFGRGSRVRIGDAVAIETVDVRKPAGKIVKWELGEWVRYSHTRGREPLGPGARPKSIGLLPSVAL